jgi:hypothetical protein
VTYATALPMILILKDGENHVTTAPVKAVDGAIGWRLNLMSDPNQTTINRSRGYLLARHWQAREKWEWDRLPTRFHLRVMRDTNKREFLPVRPIWGPGRLIH